MEVQENEFGKIEDNKVVLKAWGQHQERIIGEVKDDNPQAAITYFEERFSEFANKISEIEKTIEESENKGSFLMKLKHLKDVIVSHEGIGDYQALQERLDKQENLLNDIILKNRQRNTEIKNALMEEVKEASEKINWKEATVEIHDIKSRWIKTGNATDDVNDALEEEFWAIVKAFFDKKKNFYEDKKRLLEKNQKGYENLVSEARRLANLRGKERFDTVKRLKEEWAELGNIPKDIYGPLVDEFNYLLKPNQRPQRPKFDIGAIYKEIDEALASTRPANIKRLDSLRNTLKGYKPQEHQAKTERREAFKKIQLVKEREFLTRLAKKRFRNMEALEAPKQLALKVKLLEDLLKRDMEDLQQYVENSEKFSSHSGQINPMVEKQLNQQKSKVAVKQELLEMLKNSL